MFQKLVIIIVVPVVLVAALAAGVNALLNYEKFSAMLAEAENARFSLVAKGVKAGVEANLNLGLQLAGLGVAKAILDRERAFIAETQAVVIYATDGTILFSSGETTRLTHAPTDWLHDGEWASASTHWRAVGISLANTYGITVGGVAVLFPREPRDQALAVMKHKLILAAAWAVAGTAMLTLLGIVLLLRRTQTLIAGIALDLSLGAEAKFPESRSIRAAVMRAQSSIAELDGKHAIQEKAS